MTENHNPAALLIGRCDQAADVLKVISMMAREGEAAGLEGSGGQRPGRLEMTIAQAAEAVFACAGLPGSEVAALRAADVRDAAARFTGLAGEIVKAFTGELVCEPARHLALPRVAASRSATRGLRQYTRAAKLARTLGADREMPILTIKRLRQLRRDLFKVAPDIDPLDIFAWTAEARRCYGVGSLDAPSAGEACPDLRDALRDYVANIRRPE